MFFHRHINMLHQWLLLCCFLVQIFNIMLDILKVLSIYDIWVSYLFKLFCSHLPDILFGCISLSIFEELNTARTCSTLFDLLLILRFFAIWVIFLFSKFFSLNKVSSTLGFIVFVDERLVVRNKFDFLSALIYDLFKHFFDFLLS